MAAGQAPGIGVEMPRGMGNRDCLPKPERDQGQERYDAPMAVCSSYPGAVHAVILT